MRPGRSRERRWAPKFLEAFAKTGNATASAAAAGVARNTPYMWRLRNAEFAAAWAEAEETSADTLEAEARRRALEGRERPIYQGGQLVGHEQVYSDTLLIFLLNGRRPNIFRRPVKHEVGGKDGEDVVRIVVEHVKVERVGNPDSNT